MFELYRGVVGSRVLHVVATERSDGDQRPDRGDDSAAAERAVRQRELSGSEWSMVAEEHGVDVVDADVHTDAGTTVSDGPDARRRSAIRPALPPGDVLVTAYPDRPLSIWAGDCAPLVLCGGNGTLVAAHAGWRGLAGGVIDIAVDELTRRGDHAVVAVLGPCIHAECYEFGAGDLDAVAAGVGVGADEIARSTSTGRTSLDVPAAVAAALRRRGIDLDVVGPCTSCDERWFSHRARHDEGRHAVVAWTTPDTTASSIAFPTPSPTLAATSLTRARSR